MSQLSQAVSINPYFRVHEGKMEAAKGLMQRMVSNTTPEEKCLYYDFSINANEVFCREAYINAEGLLTHVSRVQPILEEFLQIADVIRIELHGPAAELEKLKVPMADLNPAYFVHECGVVR
jgi:quinol monooxygenase YgiN